MSPQTSGIRQNVLQKFTNLWYTNMAAGKAWSMKNIKMIYKTTTVVNIVSNQSDLVKMFLQCYLPPCLYTKEWMTCLHDKANLFERNCMKYKCYFAAWLGTDLLIFVERSKDITHVKLLSLVAKICECTCWIILHMFCLN